jgi:hypothetical protein
LVRRPERATLPVLQSVATYMSYDKSTCPAYAMSKTRVTIC